MEYLSSFILIIGKTSIPPAITPINKVIKNVDPSLNVEMQVKEALKLLLR